MLSFQYCNAYLPLPYKSVTTGVLFRSKNETTEPDVNAYLENPESRDLLNRHGQDGWELISVQQVTRGHDQIGNQNAQGWAFGYPLTIGFLFFFKRPVPV
ncbi:DUF4177 domain-containing protein [Pseudomonas sp. NPDC088368]|uniref:DUF4177 domain-containing protein n=1 Tax=Pseudomonas sp. NPDC088368 TaxID=3364453 RepID=UPI0038055AC3